MIIGGGAAGLIAAAESAKRGNDTLVVEKMSRPGRKLMITGKGRCNITNACFDIEELVQNVILNRRFMYSAFSSFMPYDTIALMEDLGVATKIERGQRVFPVSDKAVDVVDALVKYAQDSGASFIQGRVMSFDISDNKITAAVLEDGTRLECDAVALCTGGKSYPKTGSTGDGYFLARSVGHSVTKIKPSLVPIVLSNNFVPKLQGLSLKNVKITVFDGEKEIYSDFGEMITASADRLFCLPPAIWTRPSRIIIQFIWTLSLHLMKKLSTSVYKETLQRIITEISSILCRHFCLKKQCRLSYRSAE